MVFAITNRARTIATMAAPKDFTKGVSLPTLQGEGLRVTIVRTRWNDGVVSKLLEGCLASLDKCGVKKDDISVVHVPGAFEVLGFPFAPVLGVALPVSWLQTPITLCASCCPLYLTLRMSLS